MNFNKYLLKLFAYNSLFSSYLPIIPYFWQKNSPFFFMNELIRKVVTWHCEPMIF